MARGTQHRKRRPAQNARAAAVATPSKKQRPPQWQEQLFFQRLRTHAKWAYVALAAAFVLTFVLLGVGSGSTGIGDALQNAFNFGSGGTSIGKLEKKVQKHPKNANAWHDLATAYEQKQRTQDAVNALERYTVLRPKDSGALDELASQYTTLAQNYATDYQTAQADAQAAQPSTAFAPSSSTTFGKIFSDPAGLQDPIGSVIASQAQQRAQTAYSDYRSAEQNAESTFQRLAKLTPTDVTVQYQLGQSAMAASDFKAAVAAFSKFLKLSPNDVEAPRVKQLLTSARAQLSASG